MAMIEKCANKGPIKSSNPQQSIKSSDEDKIQHLQDELDTKQLDLEAKCQALGETLEELEYSRNRYADLYDFAPVGYVTIDRKGYIKEINLTGASLIGLERIQLIGMPMYVFVAQSDVRLFLNHLRRCWRTNEKVFTELSLASKSGTPIQVQLLSVPHNSAGEHNIMYKTVITDITERKQYERELARLDRLNLIGEMAAGIGHEIRNPLTAVRGFLQLYKAKEAFTPYKHNFNLMIDELDRANSIITEFLSLAKTKTLVMETQNVNTIVEKMFDLIHADAMVSEKSINMDLGNTPDLPLNAREIRQLLLNFIRNGLEAMSPGGDLTIRTFTDGNEVVLAVQDQGYEIESNVLDKIGTPFFTTKDNGTGLGLAVCYRIAARHNAVINIETGHTGTTSSVRFKILKEP